MPATSVIEKQGLAPGTQVGAGVVYVSFKKNWMGANEHTVKFDSGNTAIFEGWKGVSVLDDGSLVVSEEGPLLAAARAEGKVLVAPGTVIALTKTLCLCTDSSKVASRKNYHCERRPSGPRAAVGAGAEGRVWAVGAQAWSAPR